MYLHFRLLQISQRFSVLWEEDHLHFFYGNSTQPLPEARAVPDTTAPFWRLALLDTVDALDAEKRFRELELKKIAMLREQAEQYDAARPTAGIMAEQLQAQQGQMAVSKAVSKLFSSSAIERAASSGSEGLAVGSSSAIFAPSVPAGAVSKAGGVRPAVSKAFPKPAPPLFSATAHLAVASKGGKKGSFQMPFDPHAYRDDKLLLAGSRWQMASDNYFLEKAAEEEQREREEADGGTRGDHEGYRVVPEEGYHGVRGSCVFSRSHLDHVHVPS